MNANQETTIEARRQAIQAAIDTSKSATQRNRLGQFATPNAVAINIARYVDSLMSDRSQSIYFADPAIGTGSFFSAALEVFGLTRLRNAIGVEVDPALCEAAHELWARAGLKVVCGDFTRVVASASCPPAPNVLLANPPYVRHHHLDREAKEYLQALTQQLTGVNVNGLAGFYVYFLLLATAWMQDGGLAAWLIPSEFMDVNYGIALKHFLTDRITLIRAHRFDPHDVQFSDALVSSVVLVFRKTPPPDIHAVEFTYGGTMTEPQVCEWISLPSLRRSRKWTAHPGANNGRGSLAAGNGPTLSDFFRIQRGIATGSNKFFVLDRAEASRRRLPARYLRPILPSPRFLKGKVIESDEDGYPLLDRQLCLIDCDLAECLVKERHPALWEYLETAHGLGIKGRYLVGKRSPWYRQEHRDPAPFLCTYMGRGVDEKRPFGFF